MTQPSCDNLPVMVHDGRDMAQATIHINIVQSIVIH